MSTGTQSGEADGDSRESAGIPREDVLEELSLPDNWEVAEDSVDDGLLLVKNQNQERWQSISLNVSHRKSGGKIRARYRKAPYRRGRVGSDPIERETFDTWRDAAGWVQNRLGEER